MKHTHSDRLQRWLGKESVDALSHSMVDFYWPVAVHGVPGTVYAMPGGDFTGEIRAGQELSGLDAAEATVRRIRRNRFAKSGMSRKQLGAFASLSSIIAAYTNGKFQIMNYQKSFTAVAVTGNSCDGWTIAGLPAAGAAGAAAPTGTSPTSSTTGALQFLNAVVNANTTHFITANAAASVASSTVLLYDRLFMVAKTMASTATEAVTGTFSRYQSTSQSANNYAGGNFCFPSNPTTVLAATAHNWTVCQYTNQAGTTSQSFPSATGLSACAIHGIDLSTAGGQSTWFMSLASGDVGVQALTQMQCSASVATGTIDFVVGHPLAFMPSPVIQMYCTVDGINTAFNLTYIFDNACLAFLEINNNGGVAVSCSGNITTVSE